MPDKRCSQCGSRLRLLPVRYGYPDRRGTPETEDSIAGGCVPKGVDAACAVCNVHPDFVSRRRGTGLMRGWSVARRPRRVTMRQRLAGGIWGLLAGDAIGVPYEFMRADDISTVTMRGHGTHNQPASRHVE